MSFQYILWEKRVQVGILTINRPEVRNALNPEAWLEIKKALQLAEEDSQTRVIIITGPEKRRFALEPILDV